MKIASCQQLITSALCMITMLELYTKCKSDLHLFDFFELRFKSRDDIDTLHMTIISDEHRFNCVHEEYCCVST